jgi:hypothetical protein
MNRCQRSSERRFLLASDDPEDDSALCCRDIGPSGNQFVNVWIVARCAAFCAALKYALLFSSGNTAIVLGLPRPLIPQSPQLAGISLWIAIFLPKKARLILVKMVCLVRQCALRAPWKTLRSPRMESARCVARMWCGFWNGNSAWAIRWMALMTCCIDWGIPA